MADSEPDWRERYAALSKFVADHGGVAKPAGMGDLVVLGQWGEEAHRDIESARD